MSRFVNEAYRNAAARNGSRLYPLGRADTLIKEFGRVFGTHLGHLASGGHFEADGLLITGQSGSGKTTEIRSLVKGFNEDEVALPNGKPARFAECSLKGISTWKDLGQSSAKAIGYPINPKARLSQGQIWDVVIREAKLAGVVGIHFDEVQHMFRGKNDEAILALLDSFKGLMKNHDWPLMLIFSGVPELDGYIKREPQVYSRLTTLPFDDIEPETDRQIVHEIVGSYGHVSDLEIDTDLMTLDFLDRLITAGAYRWGLVIKLVKLATAAAQDAGSSQLTRDHFVDVWVNKTRVSRVATPFLHSGYDTMYRKENPFILAFTE